MCEPKASIGVCTEDSTRRAHQTKGVSARTDEAEIHVLFTCATCGRRGIALRGDGPLDAPRYHLMQCWLHRDAHAHCGCQRHGKLRIES